MAETKQILYPEFWSAVAL